MNGQYPETPEEFVRWAAPKIQSIETTLVGIPNTESTGIIGKVERNENDISSLKKYVWMGAGGVTIVLAILGSVMAYILA